MKGIFKLGALVTIVGMLQACSGMVTIAEREDYAQPKWYANCVETGSKGWFWWKQDYVFACGAGESVFQQAAEEQMYAIAMNNFAKRILLITSLRWYISKWIWSSWFYSRLF